MSLYDYKCSQKISAEDFPFYALIMAAMRQADTPNLTKLRAMWPAIWAELDTRYHAPGGLLPDEIKEAEEFAERMTKELKP